MIITCPNCQTRYQLASDALSAAGRQVQCAACSGLWYATPSFPKPRTIQPDPEPSDDELIFRADEDTLFSQADEDLLDQAFLRAAPPLPPRRPEPVTPAPAADAPADPQPPTAAASAQHQALARLRRDALAKRRRGMMAALPMARFRRAFRLVIALVLVGSLVAAGHWRTEIVRAVPELDSLYSLIGLGTNVVGLDFTDVKTLRTTRDGNSVLIVSAKISNIKNHVAYVPSVLVSLLGAGDQVVYEWTVTPSVRNILPGEILEIDAQLTGPPEGVRTVRLSFVEGQKESSAGTTRR